VHRFHNIVRFVILSSLYRSKAPANPTTANPVHSRPFIATPRAAAPDGRTELDAEDAPVIVVVGEFDLDIPLDVLPVGDVLVPFPADGPVRNEVSAVADEKMLM